MSAKRPGTRRLARLGIYSSLFLHSILLLATQWGQPRSVAAPGTTRVLHVAAAQDVTPQPEKVVLSGKEMEADMVTGTMVQRRIDKLVSQLEQVPAADNLQRLDRISARLDRVTNSESLEELADHFADWMNFSKRSHEPTAADANQTFDHQTAQLSDVLRQTATDGRHRYVAVLIDAAGGTLRVEMTAEDGKAAYELMQRIKANPLVEKIYRRIAMPLLDRLLQDSSDTAAIGNSRGETPEN